MSFILLATDYPPQTGGIQRYCSQLAAALQDLGHQIYVIATEYPGWQDYDARSPVPVIRVPSGGSKLAITLRLRDEAIGLAPQLSEPLLGLIATKWSPEGLGGYWAARQLKVPYGLFAYDREHILHGAHLFKWALQRFLIRRADICFAISHYTAGNFLRGGALAERIRIVGCGIDAEKFAPAPQKARQLRARYGINSRPVLLTVSRLAPYKGHTTVLQALPTILRLFPDIVYFIVGEGPFRSKIEQTIAQLQLQKSVIMTGAVPDEELCGFYTMADVMILCSEDVPGKPSEGFGLTFLEANGCGTPVIGSRLGGVPEAVDHGLSGWLVPPRNPQALAQAVTRMLRHPEWAQQMGAYGRKRALEQFSWEFVARRVEAAFAEWRKDF